MEPTAPTRRCAHEPSSRWWLCVVCARPICDRCYSPILTEDGTVCGECAGSVHACATCGKPRIRSHISFQDPDSPCCSDCIDACTEDLREVAMDVAMDLLVMMDDLEKVAHYLRGKAPRDLGEAKCFRNVAGAVRDLQRYAHRLNRSGMAGRES